MHLPPDQFVHWFRSAAPYIHAFRGRTFVIAFGGEVVADGKFVGLTHDLNLLASLGVRLVLVHGARPQIEAQLAQFGVEADAFVAGVGTGGTVMGVGRYLRRKGRQVKVHPLEPANSPTLRTGKKVGAHRIQGISDEFIPSIVNLAELDQVVDVWDGDAILMAQATCHRLGLGLGISSGANLVGAIRLAEEMGPGATVVTVFADCNKKYLSTALASAEPPQDGYLTPQVQLDSVASVR